MGQVPNTEEVYKIDVALRTVAVEVPVYEYISQTAFQLPECAGAIPVYGIALQ